VTDLVAYKIVIHVNLYSRTLLSSQNIKKKLTMSTLGKTREIAVKSTKKLDLRHEFEFRNEVHAFSSSLGLKGSLRGGSNPLYPDVSF
jgi:hypothetical protein